MALIGLVLDYTDCRGVIKGSQARDIGPSCHEKGGLWAVGLCLEENIGGLARS